ncbi:hypothetical protein [Shinella sedimenti]|uniref:Transposase n=1 Tax=Shinella sedimenti TaxID=2919913 RepID=A0ABT0CGU3_9HYPH|nr:hypothetical protein [Shinella sedimenti]MCJ8147837.1 hypothetical protein [Shinella sedimenti]
MEWFDGAACGELHEVAFCFLTAAFLPQDADIHNPARAENPPLFTCRLLHRAHKVVESGRARIDAPVRPMALLLRITTRTGQT